MAFFHPKMKVAWIVPYVSAGSGGIQTICKHISYFQSRGADCHVLVTQKRNPLTEMQIRDILLHSYGCSPDVVSPVPFSDESYDVSIATFNETVLYLQFLKTRKRCYFAQDYEPWFYPMGEGYIAARETYDFDIPIVTIGKWLAYKLAREHEADVWHTDFSVDKSIYRVLDISRNEAICAVFQPEKPRRCSSMLLRALETISSLRPDLEIFTFGSSEPIESHYPIMHLGMLSKDECNVLYNQSKVGICISSSNPSRIPFEMMAAGLPVIDIYQENTLFDYPDSVVLAAPSPPAIATAALNMLNDDDLWKSSHNLGLRFIDNLSVFTESEAFYRAIRQIADSEIGESLSGLIPASTRRMVDAVQDVIEAYLPIQQGHLREVIVDPDSIKPGEHPERYMSVQVSRPQWANDIRKARLFVWADPDQGDLKVYELQVEGDIFTAEVDFADFEYADGRYLVHAYAFLDGVDTQIAEESIEMRFVHDDVSCGVMERAEIDPGEEPDEHLLVSMVFEFFDDPR